jgi:hypothetical protein
VSLPRARRARAVIAAALLGACQAGLDLDRYAFDHGPSSCAAGEACAEAELPPCAEATGDDGRPCRDALQPGEGPARPLRLTGGLSTVAPDVATRAARVRDARLETVGASCGSWRGATVCQRGQISN